MYAFSVSPFPVKHHSRNGTNLTLRKRPLGVTQFRGARVHTTASTSHQRQGSHQIHVPKCFSEPPGNGGESDDEFEEDEEQAEITLTDPRTKRTLSVGVEHTITDNDKTYVLCYPMDDPVTFANTSDQGILNPIEDDDTVQAMLPNASAILAEDHIVLKNTAYFLTVDDQGEDLGEDDDNDDDEDDAGVGENEQDVEVIGEFLHNGVHHFVVRPMDTVLLVAEALGGGYRVLEGESLEKVTPLIEDYVEKIDAATQSN